MDPLDVHARHSVDEAPALTVYATQWCSDCITARSVLDGCGVPYRWIDINDDPEAAGRVIEINGGYRSVPTILFPDGRVLIEPSRSQLIAALGDCDGQAGEPVPSTA
jgi:mycoredoxin